MKKFFTTIFIAMLAVVLAITPMAGCSNHEHDVSSWTIVREATCTTTGLKEGYCGICYELVQEEIPIDPDAHVYGDWQVSAPTTTSEGTAIRECTECSHYIRVTLPVLTDSNYTSKITVRPSAASDGVSQYTYTSEEYGEITFNVAIGSEGIQTVGDAVSVGTMTESHNLVRSVTGTRGDKRVDSGAITDSVLAEVESSASSFSYEMYDEYTHLVSNDGMEYWMGLDGDEIYGYYTDSSLNFKIASDTNYFYGFRYYLAYSDTLSYYYGTENFLAGLYSYAKKNVNGDFKESVNSDGSYTFSFGTYIVYSGGTNGALFSQIEVNFTLTDSYTIDTFSYYSVTYANDSTAYDAETGTWRTTSYYDAETDTTYQAATFLFDENGNAYVYEYNGLKYIETYNVTQTERQSGERELTSPYGSDTRFYTDFDVTYNGSTVDYTSVTYDGTTTEYTTDSTIELVAGTTSGYDFSLTNFAPSGVVGDTITFYYKQYDSDGNYEYIEININTESSVGIFVHLNSSNSFCIKSNITGNLTIAVSSRKVIKEFTINFTSNAPSALYPTVYNYSSTVGYVESTPADSFTNIATVYVGQPLYFKSSLSSTEEGRCTESYTVTVTYEGSADDYEINESTSVYLDSSSEYVATSSFMAYKKGTYVLTLTSTENEKATCTITVTVIDAPTLDSIFTGTYSGKFSKTDDTVSVTFGEISKEEVSYTDGEGNTTTAYKCTVTATVIYNAQTNVICTYYTSLDGTIVYNVSLTQVYNPEDMLTSEMEGEALSDELYFTISLNEAFCITVTHTLGEAFEYANETAVLSD